ncbi:MAG TPA: hypothetical protein VG078_06990, partial [Acidimicrobiales bacterium]|nr:hypothetical protein [Acidimicrobiales bacterium]
MEAGLVASLEADVRSVTVELGEVDDALAALVPDFEHLEANESALAAARAELAARVAAQASPAPGRAAEARGELA